uniref:Protein CLP1 homolog n=1 Tax=Panagrellus redivivus TaxID=6233 RepID=A0A7E4W136_PANRE
MVCKAFKHLNVKALDICWMDPFKHDWLGALMEANYVNMHSISLRRVDLNVLFVEARSLAHFIKAQSTLFCLYINLRKPVDSEKVERQLETLFGNQLRVFVVFRHRSFFAVRFQLPSHRIPVAMDQASDRSEYKLNEDNELRLEVGSEELIVELVEGLAEIFGTPLVVHKRYTLPPAFRCAIFTYKGALVEIVGRPESAYIATQTPMVIYLNTHYALEQMRSNAIAGISAGDPKAHGPRVMIAGQTDVGKSTLCRLLLNYAVRFNHTPVYVDLDLGQGSVSLPGTVSALLVSKPSEVVEGFDKASTLAYPAGIINPTANEQYYLHLIETLAATINEKCATIPRINASGVVINTCGFVKDAGYTALLHAAKNFKIDVVIVLENERLVNNLTKDLPNFVKIVHEPKSGGVEPRQTTQRQKARHDVVKSYFYGTRHTIFHPFTIEISYGVPEEEQQLIIAKVGTEKLPDSCLPVGVVLEDHRTKVVKLQITSDLKNHVLAMMPPNAVIDQGLISTPTVGFVVVTEVDTARKTFTILSPQPQLPSRIALFTDVTYVDIA